MIASKRRRGSEFVSSWSSNREGECAWPRGRRAKRLPETRATAKYRDVKLDARWRAMIRRPYQKKSPTPSGGGGSRTGWRSRRSITTAGAPAHQHHVIASAAATAQARMQAEQGSIGELRGYHHLRSRRPTLANVRWVTRWHLLTVIRDRYQIGNDQFRIFHGIIGDVDVCDCVWWRRNLCRIADVTGTIWN